MDDVRKHWIVCDHVYDRTATEVWCRSDRFAVCRECEIVSPKQADLAPAQTLAAVCPACLYEQLKAVRVVHNLAALASDAAAGHIHEAGDGSLPP